MHCGYSCQHFHFQTLQYGSPLYLHSRLERSPTTISPTARALIYADWKTLIPADEFIRVNPRVFLADMAGVGTCRRSSLIRDLVVDKIVRIFGTTLSPDHFWREISM